MDVDRAGAETAPTTAVAHASETLAQGAAETLRRTVGAGVQAATDRGSSR